MPTLVDVPDLGTVEFPEEMKPEEISGAITSHLKTIADREGANVLSPMDAVRAGVGKLQQGAEKVGTTVANIPIDAYNTAARLSQTPRGQLLPKASRFKEGESLLPTKALDAMERSGERIFTGLGPMMPKAVAVGLPKAYRKAVEGMTTPGMVLAGAAVPESALVRGTMAAGAVVSLPDSVKNAVAVFKDPKATAAQKVEAASGTALDTLFAALMAHGGLTHSEAVAQFKEAGLEAPAEAKAPVLPESTNILPQAKAAAEAVIKEQNVTPQPEPARTTSPEPVSPTTPVEAQAPAEPVKPVLAETPLKAAAKIQGEIQQEATMGSRKSAGEIKDELVNELQKRLMKAPLAENAKPGETVSVDIPGDGKFTIANTAEAVTEVLERARKLKTGPEKTGVPRASIKSSSAAIEATAGENKRIRLAKEELARQESEKQPISAGPGAASPGDVPQQSQLAQLTATITAGMPHDSPLEGRVRFIEQAKTKAADAKEAASNFLGKAKAVADAFWDSYTKLKPVTDEKRAVGRWDYAMQRADHEARQFVKAIQKAVPGKLRREAMTNWIQADGDENLLRQRAAASKPNVRPGYEMALRLTPEEKTLAGNVREYLNSQLEKGREAGILSAGVDNYVNQVWNRDLLNRDNPFVKGLRGDFASEKLQPNFRFARKRFFDSYFDGEQAGFKPRNKDVGALMAVYDQSFRKAIAARAFLRDLHESKASDGKPLVEVSGYGRPVESEDRGRATLIDPKTKTEETSLYRKIDHPAMRGWKWAGKDAAGNPIFLKGDLVVHPEAYTRLRNRLQTSWWRQNPAGRAYLTASTAAKQSLLSVSGFHQVQETIHSLGHRVNPLNLDHVNFDDPVTKELVHGGLKLADYHAEQILGEGLASGGWVHKVPFIGNKILRPYTEYLFQDYIPKLKVTMAREAFDRNLKRYAKDLAGGKVTREQLAELTANQANAAFGGLNYRAMGRNPSLQDTFRAFLLAPDFLEARGRFVGQAAKPYGREQLVALGIIAATTYVGARILNEALDGDPHWDKPFSVVGGGKEYSLRTVPGDIFHLLNDPRSFWYHRLSAGARGAVELATGRDDRGVKRNLVQQAKDALSNLIPLSLHKRDDVKLWEAFANAMGLQERRFDATQEIGAAARKFRDAHRKQSPYEEVYDAEKDSYRPLRLALQSGDHEAATKAYQGLRKTESPLSINKNIIRFFNKPFTGSKALEARFIQSLDAHDRERYKQARQEQREALQTFGRIKP